MRVAVIGAGPAGLVTARELARVGIEPIVVERQDAIGGTWRFREGTEPDPLGIEVGDDRVHSSIYAGLRTNLPTKLMAFRDFPFEPDAAARDDGLWFCGHRDVLAYLGRFTAALAPAPHLRLGVTVERIRPRPDIATANGSSAWRLSLRRGDEPLTPLDVSAVAVCNGHYSLPRVPALAGRFDGVRSHSHNYRRPEPFAGKRVVILGAKSSGTDLSREIARHAERVHLCAREHDGPRPLADGLVAEPAIARLGPGRAVELVDGRRLEDVDHLLYCTGYRYDFPFLDDEVVATDGDWVGPLYLDLVPPSAPTLALIGLPFAVVPFPLVEAQARWWARGLAGLLPSASFEEMTSEVDDRVAALDAAGVARRHRLRYDERQFDYVDDLCRRAGAPQLPAWFAPLYRATREAKRRDPAGYRDASWWRGDA